ncbi:MAG: hypothetical protein LBQ27_00795 [Clostridiales bacterium]|jgi:hypothetical protein|nr:hypothetical protein [Clostridiales bacterium]
MFKKNREDPIYLNGVMGQNLLFWFLALIMILVRNAKTGEFISEVWSVLFIITFASFAGNFLFIAYADDKKSLLISIWICGACCIALGMVVLNLFVVSYYWLIPIGISSVILGAIGYAELYRHFKPRKMAIKGKPTCYIFRQLLIYTIVSTLTFYIANNKALLIILYTLASMTAYVIYVPTLKYLYKRNFYKKIVPYIAIIVAGMVSILIVLCLDVNVNTFLIPVGVHFSIVECVFLFFDYKRVFFNYKSEIQQKA